MPRLHDRRRRLIAAGAFGGAAAGSAYVGPGDLFTFSNWYGLRAYSAAKAGTKAIRVQRASDNAQTDINTLSNGTLDATTLAAFLASTTGKIVTAYDQVGTNDFTALSFASAPVVTANALGTSYGAAFSSANSTMLLASANIAGAQPNTAAIVAKATSLAADGGLFFIDNGNYNSGVLIDWVSSGNVVTYDGASITGPSAAVNTWGSILYAQNGASSVLRFNSSEVTGTAGSQGFNTVGGITRAQVGAENSGKFFDGFINEWGAILGTALNATQRGTLDANMHAAYGGW